MERRSFLKIAGVWAANAALRPQEVFAQIDPKSQQPGKEVDSLTEYLKRISGERKAIESVISIPGVMRGIKDLSVEQVQEDIQMYFPIYKAGEIKFGVPWFLLWTIHEHETTASRDTNPGGSGYVGAMQLAREHYSKMEIATASDDFEFLDPLPQRYHQRSGWATNDWQEILRAASFIEWQRDVRDYAEGEAGYLRVVRLNYSNSASAIERIEKYNQLKELFGQVKVK